jgi:hypothetical protein
MALRAVPVGESGMDQEAETELQGGATTAVARVGGTVRRACGPWTPAVHALLRHLESAGFDAAPRVLGFDGQGREMLTFIPGAAIPESLAGYRSDRVLARTAQLLRRYHDATVSFVPPPDAQWRWQVGAPQAGEVICHNDIAPWNTIAVDGEPVAFIDWDYAAPGPREWDIAFALWWFTPLCDGEGYGLPEERSRRIAAFCDAYGHVDRRELLNTVQRRQTVLYDTLRTWAAAGITPFDRLWEKGLGDGMLADRAYVRRHLDELTRHLSR